MFEYLYLACVAIVFGFFQKIADGHNEHGLKFFKGASIFFGIIWGGIGMYLITYSDTQSVMYLSLIFYRIFKIKIDYTNHAISILLMLVRLFFIGEDFSIIHTTLITISYILANFLKKGNNLVSKYKLGFILIPIVYSIIISDPYGTIVIYNIIGVYLANKIFDIPLANIK